jgi:hypothetical protein
MEYNKVIYLVIHTAVERSCGDGAVVERQAGWLLEKLIIID